MTTEPKEVAAIDRDLLHNKEIFRLLVNGVKDYAIFMLDPKGHVVTWNEGAERLKGYSADEIIGQHFSTFYTEDAKRTGHPQRELEIALKEGSYTEEGWRVRKDGSRFWANVVVTAIYENEQLVGFAKVTRDMSEQKEVLAHRLTASRQETIYRMLVSGVKDYAIFMLEPDGRVMTWNEGARRLKGYTAREIIGKHFSQFYTEEAKRIEHPKKELELAIANGVYEEEGWRIRKDGTTFWANVVITPIYDNDELVGFAKVTRDLTERRAAEEEREAASKILAQTIEELQDALEVKGRFLSTISHEVRTPMSGIIGMAELLTLQDLGENNNHVVKSIFDSSKRLLQLLNDLLDTARMESGKLTLEYRKFPVQAIVGDVAQLVRPEAMKKGLEINASCEAAVPESVCGDEFRIRQILLNLAFNAVKFTDSGEIKIDCSLIESDSEKTVVRFSVSDTGIGIASEDQSKLFKPFEQAHDSTSRLYGGSGLGLSISKSLVELMGGEIGLDSESGKGSTFWFQIPFEEVNCRT